MTHHASGNQDQVKGLRKTVRNLGLSVVVAGAMVSTSAISQVSGDTRDLLARFADGLSGVFAIPKAEANEFADARDAYATLNNATTVDDYRAEAKRMGEEKYKEVLAEVFPKDPNIRNILLGYVFSNNPSPEELIPSRLHDKLSPLRVEHRMLVAVYYNNCLPYLTQNMDDPKGLQKYDRDKTTLAYDLLQMANILVVGKTIPTLDENSDISGYQSVNQDYNMGVALTSLENLGIPKEAYSEFEKLVKGEAKNIAMINDANLNMIKHIGELAKAESAQAQASIARSDQRIAVAQAENAELDQQIAVADNKLRTLASLRK